MCAEPTYYRSPLRTLKKHGSGGGQSGQQRGRGGVQQGEDAGRGGRHVGVQGARQVGTGQQGQQALQHLWEDGIAEHGGGVGEGDGEQLQHGPDLLGLACGTRQEEGRRGDAGIGGGTCRFGWWWAGARPSAIHKPARSLHEEQRPELLPPASNAAAPACLGCPRPGCR